MEGESPVQNPETVKDEKVEGESGQSKDARQEQREDQLPSFTWCWHEW